MDDPPLILLKNLGYYLYFKDLFTQKYYDKQIQPNYIVVFVDLIFKIIGFVAALIDTFSSYCYFIYIAQSSTNSETRLHFLMFVLCSVHQVPCIVCAVCCMICFGGSWGVRRKKKSEVQYCNVVYLCNVSGPIKIFIVNIDNEFCPPS